MARILVVDDEADLRLTLRHVLERAGHQVSEAVDGRDGLQQCVRARPDLVLLDIVMPNADGVETIGEIQRAQPGVPIIAMSGGGSTGDSLFLDIARQMGVSRTLRKPMRNAALLEAVADCLDPRGAAGGSKL
jgi:CheY-like chemotaxis protein